MFEHGSFRPGRIVKACRAKVAAVSKRHAASHSSRGQYSELTSDQEKTRQKSSLRSSLPNLATNTFSRRPRRRRCADDSYNSHASTTSSSTLSIQPSEIQEYFKSDIEQTATQTQIPSSTSSSETGVAPAEIGIRPRPPRLAPDESTIPVNIDKIPARYRLRIRQLKRDAANRAEMEKMDNKDAENRDDAKPRGLPRSATSYRLSSLAIRGTGSNIPLPSSSSTSSGFSTVSSRHVSQQGIAPSSSHAKFPPRRSSIVQRHGLEETEPQAEAMPSSSRGLSKGTVNNPTRVTSGVPVTPQRQLMQPLGPPFPRSKTLAGPAFHPTVAKVTEKDEPSSPAKDEVEDNKTEISFDMCEVVEDEETVEDEDEETVKVLKSTCPEKSDIEKERKWKLTPLERISNKVRVETGPELPSECPPGGGWLWDEDDARLVKTAQPQQYWLGRFSTILNSFHHEDSFNEPDSATGKNKTSGLMKPTSLSSGHLDEHRIKRAFVALESLCTTPEATESLKEFRTAYCRRFGDQWTKWLVVGREEEDTSMLGEMSRVFLKRGERRTPEARSERKTSGGYSGKFNNILRTMRRSLA